MTNTQPIAEAIKEAFGEDPWLAGDVLKKAKTKNAVSQLLSKPPAQLKVGDIKNLTNQLWEEGIIEIIPPKDSERSFKFRLVKTVAEAKQQVAEANESAQEARQNIEAIQNCYLQLRQETQFRHVYLSDINLTTGISIQTLHTWAAEKARAREFELGQGDWSLATESQRAASIKINGIHYLTIGQLN